MDDKEQIEEEKTLQANFDAKELANVLFDATKKWAGEKDYEPLEGFVVVATALANSLGSIVAAMEDEDEDTAKHFRTTLVKTFMGDKVHGNG